MLLMVALAVMTAPMANAGADAAQATVSTQASGQSGEQSSGQGVGQSLVAPPPSPFPAPQLPPNPHDPIPRGNRAGWISPDDYPPAALRRNLQGGVKVVLGVNSGGRVETCTIVETSTHAILDSETCRSTLRRSRFSSATDEDGTAIQGYYFLGTRWMLPGESEDDVKESPQEAVNRETYTRQMAVQADVTVPAMPIFSTDQAILFEEERFDPVARTPSPNSAQQGAVSSLISTHVFVVQTDSAGMTTDCRFVYEYHRYGYTTAPVDEPLACQTLKDTVRFSPARNAMGQPMASILYLVMKQRVPATVTPPTPIPAR